MLKDNATRLEYMTIHYWDNFNFKDTTYIHLPDITEQAVVNYIDFLKELPVQKRNDCLNHTLLKASVEPIILRYFVDVFHDYLFNQDSPFYNESFYEPIARFIISSSHFDNEQKSKALFDLKVIQTNKVGTKASDFTFFVSSGEEMRLSELKSSYIILLFYDPDCSNCQQLISLLKTSNRLNELLDKKIISVLAIYPFDDVLTWKGYSKNISFRWINGIDREMCIQNRMLYNLIKMPAVYILNDKKEVIKKDADYKEVINFIYQF